MSGKPCCLTIAGSDSGGGAGVQQDLKVFANFDVHGLSVITGLTAQNTQRVKGIYPVPPDFVDQQIKALLEDFTINFAKTGMLYAKEVVSAVAKYADEIPIVVDPVMVATSGDLLLQEDAIEVLKKELIPRSALITPNVREAEVLTGMKIKNLEDMEKAGELLSEKCPVLIKGGHLQAVDVLIQDGNIRHFKGRLIEGKFHGTGCAYSAAITANLAKGFPIERAVEISKKYIQSIIENSFNPGKGSRVLDPLYNLRRDAEKISIVEELSQAVRWLLNIEGFEALIPEVGINFGYALSKPRSIADVAALNGRIIRVGGRAYTPGCVEFGASRHISRILIAASRLCPEIRSCINIRYSQEVIEACRRAGLRVASFNRDEEPPGVSTMEWGTETVLKREGCYVDIIYDEGSKGKEPMIRVLGNSPAEVVKKVKRIIIYLARGHNSN